MEIIADMDKIRIDKFLNDKLEYSRSRIQKLLESKDILVNNKQVKNNYMLRFGDSIYVNDDFKEDVSIEKENIPLDIYYEDDDLIVVNKPSGMVVHPAVGNHSGTLVNALMYHCNDNLSKVNGDVRPGIVHRIDRDTSGLLLVAKNDYAHNSLASQISEKKVYRKYIALVHGVIDEDTATIDAPIGRDKNNRKKMCVTGDNSKRAITNIKVLERFKNSTLIECVLDTGRTHQIRVHLAYINHPVVNDPVYGYKNMDDKEFGQMLHAETIGFIHPRTLKYMEFTSPVPDKFKEILQKYKNYE